MAVHSAKQHRQRTKESSPRSHNRSVGHRSRMARGAHRAAHLDVAEERRRLLLAGGLALAAPLGIAILIMEIVR